MADRRLPCWSAISGQKLAGACPLPSAHMKLFHLNLLKAASRPMQNCNSVTVGKRAPSRAAASVLALGALLSGCGGGSSSGPQLAAPAGLTYGTEVEVLLAGVEIAPIQASLESGNGSLVYSVTPKLPAGLTLQPATGEISGIPWSPSPSTTYSITASSSMGSATAELSLEVREDFEAPRYAYSLHLGESIIGQWRIDSATGDLHNLGAVRTGIIPYRLVADPLGRFLYVSTHLTQAVGVHRIDPQTGLLSPVELQLTEGGSVELAIDPTGRFLYVANLLLDSVQGFRINPTTGSLTPIGEPFPIGEPAGIAIDPTGERLFVTSYSQDLLAIYELDPVGGQIRLLEHAIGIDGPFGLELHPNGEQLYVTNFDSDAVSLIDVSTPGAAEIVGAWAVGEEPVSLELTHDGGQLHVGCAAPGYLYSFAVGADGLLQDRGSQPLAGLPSSLRELGDGERLAVGLYDLARLQLFDLRDDLAPEPTDYRPTQPEFTDLHVVHGAQPQYRETAALYTANIGQDSVSAFTKADGNANFVASGPDTWIGDSPSSVVADFDQSLLVVNAQLSGLLTPFKLDANGQPIALPPDNSKPTGGLPRAMNFTNGGRYLLTCGNAGLLLHRVNQTTNELVDVFGVVAGESPTAVVGHPSDRFAFVANRGDDTVQVFAMDLPQERLQLLPQAGESLPPGSEPRALAISPDGSRLAVACGATGSVHLMRVDPVTGTISQSSQFDGLNDPRALAFDRDGSHLAVAEYGADQVRLLELFGTVILQETGSVGTSAGPHAIALAENELVVATFDAARVETFAWLPDHSLAPIDSFSLAAGAGPVDVAVGYRWLDF